MSWVYGRVLCRFGNPERFIKCESNVSCHKCRPKFQTHKSSYILDSSSFRGMTFWCTLCFEKRKVKLGKCSKLDFIQNVNRHYLIIENHPPFKWDRDSNIK